MTTENRFTKITDVVNRRQELIVVLEDIHDPHNAQAVLRSCEAFGVQNIYFIFDKESRFNPQKVGKLSSCSANKWLDYNFFDSAQSCYTELKNQGYIICATTLSQNSKSLFEFDFCFHKKIVVVFGNEHRGLSDFAIKNSDFNIAIPMFGMVQSLNLSVSAGIIIYEITRQRYNLGIENFKLTKDLQEKLSNNFLER